jgi:hypothetical protein
MHPSFICPACWLTYIEEDLIPGWPVCADCHWDVWGTELRPFEEFVRARTVDELRETIRSWQRAKHYPKAFRQSVIQRIRGVLQLKLAGTGES